MKKLGIILGFGLLITGCKELEKLEPFPPSSLICVDATSQRVQDIKSKVETLPYRDEKLDALLYRTRNDCFNTKQVIELIQVLRYEDDQLTAAKDLYHRTTDTHNFYDVADSFKYLNNRTKLREYVKTHQGL